MAMVHYAPTPQGCHPGINCDKSGQYPIVGWRFKLKGSDPSYDLCEAEFDKLPDAEKANYEKIAPPARAAQSEALTADRAPDPAPRLTSPCARASLPARYG